VTLRGDTTSRVEVMEILRPGRVAERRECGNERLQRTDPQRDQHRKRCCSSTYQSARSLARSCPPGRGRPHGRSSEPVPVPPSTPRRLNQPNIEVASVRKTTTSINIPSRQSGASRGILPGPWASSGCRSSRLSGSRPSARAANDRTAQFRHMHESDAQQTPAPASAKHDARRDGGGRETV
jgi:hypothetical protein